MAKFNPDDVANRSFNALFTEDSPMSKAMATSQEAGASATNHPGDMDAHIESQSNINNAKEQSFNQAAFFSTLFGRNKK